jgi:isoquinoline 1-oxidoreductase beta subunit
VEHPAGHRGHRHAGHQLPTRFPINHGTLGFTPLPLEPSTPQSPADGLDSAF